MGIEFRHKSGILPLDRTAVMGILNVTPDSFSDGGRFVSVGAAVDRALYMQQEGADIVDIGAQSTRPGHIPIDPEEEWARLEPVLTALRGQLTVPISIDTFSPFVAEKALTLGADILNDVSGSLKNGFPSLAANHGAGLIMMARDCSSPKEVHDRFAAMLSVAEDAHLPLSQVCLDLGIGFHDSQATDVDIVKHLPSILNGLPKTALLCGASRKRVIAHCANDCPVSERLAGTIAFHTAAVLHGVSVVRVHDIKEAKQAAAVADALRTYPHQRRSFEHDGLETF